MTDQISTRLGHAHLLLVEDDDDHAHLATRVLQRCDAIAKIDRVRDGLEALDFLRGQREQPHPQFPSAILVDLKLPRMNGLEFLREIQEDTTLSRLTTIVVTTSATEEDRKRSYQAGANSYLVKPIDPIEFQNLFRVLGDYWAGLNVPPYLEDTIA